MLGSLERTLLKLSPPNIRLSEMAFSIAVIFLIGAAIPSALIVIYHQGSRSGNRSHNMQNFISCNFFLSSLWELTDQSVQWPTDTGPKPLIFWGECDNTLAMGALILGEIWIILHGCGKLHTTSNLWHN